MFLAISTTKTVFILSYALVVGKIQAQAPYSYLPQQQQKSLGDSFSEGYALGAKVRAMREKTRLAQEAQKLKETQYLNEQMQDLEKNGLLVSGTVSVTGISREFLKSRGALGLIRNKVNIKILGALRGEITSEVSWGDFQAQINSTKGRTVTAYLDANGKQLPLGQIILRDSRNQRILFALSPSGGVEVSATGLGGERHTRKKAGDPYADLMKLKKLYDMGIISGDEYNKKKNILVEQL